MNASDPYKWHLDTLILLVVNVPVLSEQMVVAFPMVSHADKWRTKFLSISIFFIEYANEIVTANGNPSGTATTTMVTATIKKSSSCTGSVWSKIAHIMVNTTNKTTATAMPRYPMCLPISPSLSCNGVSARSSVNFAINRPHSVFSPTATAIIKPSPDTIFVPFINNGCNRFFFNSFDSPVNPASCAFKFSVPKTKMPSAGMVNPSRSTTKSPTTTSSNPICFSTPPRNTMQNFFLDSASCFLNCSSF
mmetsp:Transcript_1868/g.3026  ORF Transcript_1868/g.3026 Transcript_1868/m.3026 type:complete len:248 (+) Transcript_1868:694-1437(+)